MADSENHIPTLTDIAHVGNQDMLNHFDGHQFDDEAEEIDTPLAFENASETENTSTIEDEDSAINEIPSITLEDESTPDLMSEDFSEAMQSISAKTPANELDKDAIKEKINQAISEALPGIEAQLKGKLYSKFGI